MCYFMYGYRVFKTNVLVLFAYIYKMFYNDNGDSYV